MSARFREWRHRHPRGTDILIALGVFAVALLIRPDGPAPITSLSATTVALLVLACTSLVWRRTQPILVCAITAATGFAGVMIAGGPSAVVLPAFIGVYSVATLRRRSLAILAASATALLMVLALVLTDSSAASSPTTYAVIAWGGMAAAIGIAVRSQRAIVAAAEERARRAEETRDERARQAVTEERLRIARELHDVVAHHIAVISVQSGVARHLLTEDPEQAAEALGHIREASQVVLSELTAILGLLRSPEDETRAPAPGMDQFDSLVDSVRRSGVTVVVRTTGTSPELTPVLDLTLFRVLQEALTNARKHGTGSAEVGLTYRSEDILVEVTNPGSPGRATGSPGHGLLGMRERVAAVGGTLATGTDAHGAFTVTMTIPVRLHEHVVDEEEGP
jgi:signal transduction histidine kinase